MADPLSLPALLAEADDADRYKVDAVVPTDALRALIEALQDASLSRAITLPEQTT